MPVLPNLPELKNRLQNIVADNKGMAAIDELLQLLPDGSPKHKLLLGLKASLKELKSNVTGMQLSFDESSRFHARYNKQLLDFIADLEADDFDPNIRRSQLKDTQKIRRGHVLYRVAKEMQLEKEYRCLVRIAFDEEMVLEDLELDDDTSLKSGIRISKYMRVEIKDPSAAGVFDIRSTSEPVQLIDDDDFTEWRFYVKPLLPGKHTLELTVTIMERIDGQDRVREKTLEESVVIITEAPAQEEEPAWKKDNEQLTMAAVVDTFVPQPVSYPPSSPAPSRSPVKRQKRGGYLRGAALSLALLMTVTATYAYGPKRFAVEVDWVNTRYIQDSEDSYDKFLEKHNEFLKNHPEVKHKETATFKRAKAIQRDDPAQPERAEEAMVAYLGAFGGEAQYVDEALWTIAELSEQPDDYNNYLQREGENEMDEAARAAITRLEPKLWEAISSQPTALQLDRYLRIYPQGEHRSTALKQLADSSNWQRNTTLPTRLLKDTTGWQQRIQQYAKEAAAQDADLGETIQRRSQQPALQPSVSSTTKKNTSTNELTQTKTPPTTSEEQIATSKPQTPAPNTERKVTTTAITAITAIADNMVRVAGDTFTMGCQNAERDGDCDGDEEPAHEVTLSTFYISKYEVTQAQWRAVMGSDPPKLHNTSCDQCPVESVSWDDIQDFLKELNTTTSRKYRLPIEAEWEYAARGGNGSKGYLYSGSNDINKVAWYFDNARSGNTHGSEKTTRPVGGKQGNELGLYDMSGNVYEWCSDWYGEDYYRNSVQENPNGPESGSYRVYRGGSWYDYPQLCRSALRDRGAPMNRYGSVGFRLARSF